VYSNNLYSREFLQIVRDQLTPRGVLFLWSDEHLVSLRTVTSVFESVRVYEIFYLASREMAQRNLFRLRLLSRAFWSEDSAYFKDLQKTSGLRFLFATKKLNPDLQIINQDWKPHGEYFLGISYKYKLLSSRRESFRKILK
jgi:spermidine synthase